MYCTALYSSFLLNFKLVSYVCIYVFVYCVCTGTYAQVCVHTHTNTHTHTYTCARAHTHTRTPCSPCKGHPVLPKSVAKGRRLLGKLLSSLNSHRKQESRNTHHNYKIHMHTYTHCNHKSLHFMSTAAHPPHDSHLRVNSHSDVWLGTR